MLGWLQFSVSIEATNSDPHHAAGDGTTRFFFHPSAPTPVAKPTK